ncbi:putative E3 ubiquitin-protein ligase SINA-like 6 [Miscanthus floridulus]|uniref:putative E3 ubiquitin-protein ligase SINA-like 6 n=1 Tax=Miscanthus floridulus TaxID=154761 RepID=UPI00345B304A
MVYDLTVADESVLRCGICFLPLKPPIFHARYKDALYAVGHALCSSCSNRLKNARKCHLCHVAMPDGYQRCHALEDVVNSIHGPCPHAPYGCDTRPTYHAREEHLLQCPHAPCHCPGSNACSFVGPVATLIKHLTAAHGWSCTAEACDGASFGVYLRDGFNFVTTVRGSAHYTSSY